MAIQFLFFQPDVGDPEIDITATMLRLLVDGIFDEGVIRQTDFAVTQRAAGGANRSVDVAPGQAVIYSDSSGEGKYFGTGQGIANVPLTVAPGAGFRIDRIYLKVRDSLLLADSLSNYDGLVSKVDGINTSGGLGTLPNQAIELAQVRVNASATIITNSNITDKRAQARPAMWTARPASPRSGNTALSTANKFEFYNGTTWITSDDFMVMHAENPALGGWFGGSPGSTTAGRIIEAGTQTVTFFGGGQTLTLENTFSKIHFFVCTPQSDDHLISITRRTSGASNTFTSNTIPLRAISATVGGLPALHIGAVTFSYLVIGEP